MVFSTEDIADANRQFWNLVAEIRNKERKDPTDSVLADLYEDLEYLHQTGITSNIRERCGNMVSEWHNRDGGGALRPFRVADDREPA